MAPAEPVHQLRELDVDTCVARLESAALGRLGFIRDGVIEVLPLNYRLWEGAVLFRTGWGELLDWVHGHQVAFEVDDHEAARKSGWSVVVRGQALEISEPAEIARAAELGLQPWAPGRRDHVVRISPASITGREIGPPV